MANTKRHAVSLASAIEPTVQGEVRVLQNRNFFIADEQANLPTTAEGAEEGDFAVVYGDSTLWVRVSGSWTEISTAGVTDHGALTGLADDDHTAYATNTELTTHEGDTSTHGVAEVADAAHDHDADYEDAGAVSTHAGDTSTHGVAEVAGVADITFEALEAAGDVGTSADQLAEGNHTHVGGSVTRLIKPATTTIQSDDTLTADTTLQFAVVAGTRYKFKMMVLFGGSGNSDFKYQLTGPTLTSGTIRRHSETPGSSSGSDDTHIDEFMAAAGTNAWTGTNLTGFVTFEGIFTPSANGTVEFQWAANINNASDTSVLRNSFLEYEEV